MTAIEYRKGGDAVRAAWFAYKAAGGHNLVAFVAGWNAANAAKIVSNEAQEIIIRGLAANFSELAELCDSIGRQERAEAYRNASFDCSNVLTGGLGWMLDIQAKIKKLDS